MATHQRQDYKFVLWTRQSATLIHSCNPKLHLTYLLRFRPVHLLNIQPAQTDKALRRRFSAMRTNFAANFGNILSHVVSPRLLLWRWASTDKIADSRSKGSASSIMLGNHQPSLRVLFDNRARCTLANDRQFDFQSNSKVLYATPSRTPCWPAGRRRSPARYRTNDKVEALPGRSLPDNGYYQLYVYTPDRA